MIDPYKITNFNQTDNQLQEFVLFCPAVAGKKAIIIAEKLDQFLSLDRNDIPPFDKIRNMIASYSLTTNMEHVKLGKYNLLSKCYRYLVESNINLKTCSIEELEQIPGFNKKTSRFFILHSRLDQNNIACLDTWQLTYLKDQGYNVPKTLTSKSYDYWEKIYLDHAKNLGAESIAEFDLEIWNRYTKKIVSKI